MKVQTYEQWANHPSSYHYEVMMNQRFYLSAARAIFKVLKWNGLPCVFDEVFASFLYGLEKYPQFFSVTVLAPEDFSAADVVQLLVHTSPRYFSEAGTNGVNYHDYEAVPDHSVSCFISCIPSSSTIAQVPYVTLCQRLPTRGLLAIISKQAELTALLHAFHGSPPRQEDWFDAPQRRLMDRMFQLAGTEPPTPLDPVLASRAVERLLYLAKILPEYAQRINSVIRLCLNTRHRRTVQFTSKTKELLDMAHRVVSILEEEGIHCALLGGLACALYGSEREPEDVDFVVFPPTDQDAENTKQIIVAADPTLFSLRPSRVPGATHKLLHCRLEGSVSSYKIDILVPPTYHLPTLTPSQTVSIQCLPVVPFEVLISQKLQAWQHRRNQPHYARQFNKRLVDKADLERLFGMIDRVEGLCSRSPKPFSNRSLFSEEFEDLCRKRAREFCDEYPDSERQFRRLGLLDDHLELPQRNGMFE